MLKMSWRNSMTHIKVINSMQIDINRLRARLDIEKRFSKFLVGVVLFTWIFWAGREIYLAGWL